MDARVGTYRAVAVTSEADLGACLALRAEIFRGHAGACDRDRFDDACGHVAVERIADGAIVASFRYMVLNPEDASRESYSGQYYGLSRLGGFGSRLVEIGRFCVAPGVRDADVLRMAWGAVARIVEAEDAGLLFGCSSFHGVDPGLYSDALGVLRDRYLAPEAWRPEARAEEIFDYSRALGGPVDPRAGMRGMPPLLKTYLAMGGWVSDHAVIDRDLDTLHVFTGVEIAAIPPARRRSILAAC